MGKPKTPKGRKGRKSGGKGDKTRRKSGDTHDPPPVPTDERSQVTPEMEVLSIGGPKIPRTPVTGQPVPPEPKTPERVNSEAGGESFQSCDETSLLAEPGTEQLMVRTEENRVTKVVQFADPLAGPSNRTYPKTPIPSTQGETGVNLTDSQSGSTPLTPRNTNNDQTPEQDIMERAAALLGLYQSTPQGPAREVIAKQFHRMLASVSRTPNERIRDEQPEEEERIGQGIAPVDAAQSTHRMVTRSQASARNQSPRRATNVAVGFGVPGVPVGPIEPIVNNQEQQVVNRSTGVPVIPIPEEEDPERGGAVDGGHRPRIRPRPRPVPPQPPIPPPNPIPPPPIPPPIPPPPPNPIPPPLPIPDPAPIPPGPGLDEIANAFAEMELERRPALGLNEGAVIPPRRVAVPAEAVIPARTSGDPRASQVKAGGKIGDRSVDTVHVVDTAPSFEGSSAQDIIGQLQSRLRGASTNVIIDDNSLILCYDWTIPRNADIANHPRIASRFGRYNDNFNRCEVWTLTWDPALAVASVDPTIVDEYAPNNLVNARTVASHLRGISPISMEMCNMLCTLPLDNMYKFSLVGLFTVGHIIADFLFWLERGLIDYGLGNQRAGAIAVVDLSATGNAANAQVETLTTSCQIRRIPINRRWLANHDINVLRALSMGTAYFWLENQVVNYVHQVITTDPIYFLIYQDHANALPAAGIPTAAHVITTLQKLARLLDVKEDYAAGWTRAQTIINGHIEVAMNRLEFITAGLEIGRVSMPDPQGMHIVWQLLSVTWNYEEQATGMEAEYERLASMTQSETVRIGAALAGLYGLGVSSYLNMFNLSGRCLNIWARRVPGDILDALNVLFIADEDYMTPPICRAACSLVTSMTGFVLCWKSFRSTLWCGGMNYTNGEAPDGRYWCRIWADYVPYVVRPEAMCWVIANLLSVWGLSGPRPKVHLDREIIAGIEAISQIFAMYRGDAATMVIAGSDSPYVLGVYPLYLINTLRQHWNVNEPWMLSIQYARSATDGSICVEPDYHEGQALQPQYCQQTRVIIPGTFRTYDWTRGRFMMVSLRRVRLPAEIWSALMASETIEHANSGIVLRHPAERAVVTSRRINFGIMKGRAEGGNNRPRRRGEDDDQVEN
uniref:Capsid protein n=1 Tax=Culex vishnui subgroup totivirus TaxID=2686045 RepID=A0A7R7D2N0_9VIRU|nr:capsid protein [Culex vishnui subgroup totivirus]